jgi:c-di-AMP phosphodiesterase-like protein
MEQNIVIYIGIWKWLVIMAGIVSTAWYTAYRLGRVETRIEVIETSVSNINARIDNLYNGRSPIALLPKGVKILDESGLKEWINDNRQKLFDQCKANYVMKSPYDVQIAAFSFFDKIGFPSEFELKLKNSAFENGVSLENIRRVGGIYFRDICLDELGLDVQGLEDVENNK